MCISTVTFIHWKLNDKILNFFKHKINITVVLLSCGVFKCNKLSVQLKSTLGMMFEVLYKFLNCAADKTNDAGQTAITDCNYYLQNNTINDVFITSWYKSLKADTSREL